MSIEKLELDVGLVEECLKTKWYPIAQEHKKEDKVADCALCEYYNEMGCRDEGFTFDTEKLGRVCNGNQCPIAEKVGTTGCARTPHEQWVIEDDGTKEQADAAWEEVAFLEDLRTELYEKLEVEYGKIRV